MRCTTLTMVTGAAAVLVAILPPSAFSGAATATEPMACTDVAVFGVKGSGQNKTDPDGAGPEVREVIDAIKGTVTDLEYVDFPIPYPAEGVEVMVPSKVQVARILASGGKDVLAITEWKRTKLEKYLSSISIGTGVLTTAVSLRATRCPDESLLLVGYSQGAAVIHQFLNQRQAQGDLDTLDRVAAVVLIADPDKVANTVAETTGSGTRGSQGVEVFRGSGSLRPIRMPGPYRDTPEDLAEVTVSVCNKGDIVCDWTPLNMTHFKRGARIHTSYVGSAATRAAAALVATFL